MSTSDTFHVRLACTDDLETLVDYSAAMALETERRVLDRDILRRGILGILKSAAKGFYLVTEASQGSSATVIGQMMVTYEWSDWRNATFWWIQSVYVHPKWRRRGAYRSMHAHVLGEARTRTDVCGVRLYVEAQNASAQATYRNLGLAPSSYLVFETDFVLSKDGQPVGSPDRTPDQKPSETPSHTKRS